MNSYCFLIHLKFCHYKFLQIDAKNHGTNYEILKIYYIFILKYSDKILVCNLKLNEF